MAETKMALSDRTFALEVIDGTQPKSSVGMVDPRLFNGGNKLHIVKDPATNFWSFSYEQGLPPKELRCVFTSFTAALKHAELYYKTRNLQVVEVSG